MPPIPRDEALESSSLLHLNLQQQRQYQSNGSFSDFSSTVVAEDSVETTCFRRAWLSYSHLLERRPLIVKSVTAMFILGGGDLCGQGVEHLRYSQSPHASGVDWFRVSRFAAFGLFGAPWSHYYFHHLDYYLPPSDKPCTLQTAIKLAIDQGIQAPALLVIMICLLSLMKGEGIQGMKQDLVNSYMTALLANWKLWIPFSLVNMAFVKPAFRVLFVNCVFFIWTIILSLMLNTSS